MDENDFFGLRALGYTGPIDDDGYVAREPGDRDSGSIAPHKAPELTEAMVNLLHGLRPAVDGPPKFWLLTRIRQVREQIEQVQWFGDLGSLTEALEEVNVLSVAQAGEVSTPTVRYVWGVVPDMDTVMQLPTREAVSQYPQFYVSGPGGAVAELTPCPHGYHLTDSCPGCDTDAEKRQELLDVVTGPTEQEKAREKRQASLENHIWLARNEARNAQKDNQQQFLNAIRDKGAVRAMQLHAKDAAKLDLAVRVWQKALDVGPEYGWTVALDHAYMYALQQLRDSATAKASGRFTAALAAVNADAADELLSAIDTVRKTNQ